MSVGRVDAQLLKNKGGKECSDKDIPNSLAVGLTPQQHG